MKQKIIYSNVVLLGAVALLCGCQTPDLKPFAEATATMRGAVDQGQKICINEFSELKTIQSAVFPGNDALQKFEANWSVRVGIMEAMVEYADALAAVADAPRQRAENTKAIGDAVEKLASYAGPYGAVAGSSVEIVRKVDNWVAQVRAAKTLREKVTQADPLIAAVADALMKDFKGIEAALRPLRAALPQFLEDPYKKKLKVRDSLERRIEEGYAILANDIQGTNWVQELANFYGARSNALDLIAETDRWYLPLQTDLQQRQLRLSTAISFLDETEEGIDRWKKVHEKLKEDLHNNTQPNWRLLLEDVQQIKSQIEKIKSL